MSDLLKFPSPTRILCQIWVQLIFIGVLTAGRILLEFLPHEQQHPVYLKLISFLNVWVVAWTLSRGVNLFREAPILEGILTSSLRPLVFTFARIVIFSFAFLFALDTLGISITPLLASLGVGSLAVGLALQDTLGNLFSGLYLYIDRPIAIGDWVRLESGIEGQVVSIGWRTTQLQIPQENRVVIPNSKLSSSILVNYNLPTPGTMLTLPLSVAYGSDLERVQRVLIRVVEEVRERFPILLEHKGEAMVRFTHFGESSIDLTLGVRIKSFPEQALIRHELIKRIPPAFETENIQIPFPTRIVRYEEGSRKI